MIYLPHPPLIIPLIGGNCSMGESERLSSYKNKNKKFKKIKLKFFNFRYIYFAANIYINKNKLDILFIVVTCQHFLFTHLIYNIFDYMVKTLHYAI